MTVYSKTPKVLSTNEYLHMYESLNDPAQITYYTHNGCFLIYRNGQQVKLKSELEEYGRLEREDPDIKPWYEFKFIPVKGFRLIKTSRGIIHCMIDEVNDCVL